MGPKEFLCSICCCQCLGVVKTREKQPLLRYSSAGKKKYKKGSLQLDVGRFNFFQSKVSLWNTLPAGVVGADSLRGFKRELDQFLTGAEIASYGSDGRKKLVYSTLESPRDYERNLWSSPHDSSHTQADDDRELFDLLTKRKQADKDSEEWQKLNYDIHTLRQIRRQLRNRWKWILEELGFQNEADTLLFVTKSSTIHSRNLYIVQEMLQRLTKETSIFLNECQVPERYLFVLDRLFALDAAEDFFVRVSQRYPKDGE